MSRVIAILACLSLSSVALADADLARAEARWKQGKAFYDAGQWDRAIAEFRAVWDVTKEPDLLFGIALALDKKGDVRGALAEAKHYLELAPNGTAANEARELVVVLTPKVEALDAAAAAEAKRKQEADAAERARKRDEQARREREQEADAAERRSKGLRWAGIGAAVVGGALVGVGVKFGLDAKRIDDDLSGHTTGAWTDDELDTQAEGRSANRKFIALTAVGGALVVGGAITYVLGMRAAPERSRLGWTVQPVARGGAVVLGGRF